MTRFVSRLLMGALCTLLLPLAAFAQTSSIAGEVKDPSGALLPGVLVEVASPVLIEQVRSAKTDGSGSYRVISLRPGLYSVTFTLPGFNTVKRENVELQSDFTATINAELRVGSIEETITVAADSPIVDVQSITTRTVMTREVMDSLPTGRNIQAMGIMIPGASLSVGGGGALSRDVGGSGQLQQSPLQYRGSADTVQTIEGLRLNNLCAAGQFGGVYWNDNSFQEISYVTGADSAEVGQGGMRVSMVPRDGGNTFKGTAFVNFAGESFTSDNCAAPGAGLFCTRSNLSGDTTFNTNNRLTNVSMVQKIWDVNPSIGGPIMRDKLWFNYTFRHWGTNKTVADSFFDLFPTDPFKYQADLARPSIDDGHIVSNVGRIAWQVSSKDKITLYHDNQRKFRNHWGIASTVPPDASAIQVTPTSFAHVTRWSRTQSNRLLLEAGFSMYDQEFTELYQPEVTGISDKVWNIDAIRKARAYNIFDNATGKNAGAWNNPADHFSLLRTFAGSASYVTGAHSLKFGAAVSTGDWRLTTVYSGDVTPITYNNGAPVSVTLRLPTDRRNGIKADTGIFAQDLWMLGRITLTLGLRYDSFIGETRPEDLLAGRFNVAQHFENCADGKNNAKLGCTGQVQNWKDMSPRVGVAWDVFGDGKTAVKMSIARYVAGEAIATANAANPITVLGLNEVRSWTDGDKNGSPLDSAGNIQLSELGPSPSNAFGRNVSTTTTDPDVLNGFGKRGYNMEYTVSAQRQLAPRMSVNGGYYRRAFGNQTFTDDLRYGKSSYDGPFCINAPSDASLPGGGGYQVCGLYDLKPSVFALGQAANSVITFSDNYGGETNLYQGYDINLDARLPRGAFLRAGVSATARTFDNCNLLNAGYDASSGGVTVSQEAYPDGTTYCHREYPYRPDVKMSGSYPLPFNIVISGTYQFSRGVQTGGAGPSILATWALGSASFAPGAASNSIPVGSTLGRTLNAGAATKSVQLIREGLDYGKNNLSQLDVRLSKRVAMGRSRFKVDLDLYNMLNSSWPYTVSPTFSTASTATWLKPTNVLQSRFFKVGATLDF